MIKKSISILLILSISLALFIGCSGSNEISNEKEISVNSNSGNSSSGNNEDKVDDKEKEASDEKITLSFATWGVSEEATNETFNAIAAAYTELHPNVNIEFIGIPFGDIKKQTFVMAASNDAPDIIQTHTAWFSTYATSDIIVPLDDLLGEEYVNDIIDSLRSDYSYNGKLMGVPWAPSPYILYWNKELFKEAGLDPEQPPTTYDEMIEYAEKIATLTTDNGDQIYGFGEATDKLPINGLVALRNLYSFGGSLYDENGNVDLNTPEVKEMFSFYKNLAEKNLTPSSAKLKDLRNLFSIGRLGMYMDGYYGRAVFRNLSGQGEAFDEVWGCTLVPKNATGESVSIVEAHGLVISKDCEYPEVAADFIKFMTNEEMITLYHNTNDVLSARKSLSDSPNLNDSDFAKVCIDQLNNYSHALPVNHPGMEQSFLDIAEALQKVTLADYSVDEVVNELDQKLKELLK